MQEAYRPQRIKYSIRCPIPGGGVPTLGGYLSWPTRGVPTLTKGGTYPSRGTYPGWGRGTYQGRYPAVRVGTPPPSGPGQGRYPQAKVGTPPPQVWTDWKH